MRFAALADDARQPVAGGAFEAVIDAVSPLADEECIVLLGRIARSTPAL
jgi:hypothetical protein